MKRPSHATHHAGGVDDDIEEPCEARANSESHHEPSTAAGEAQQQQQEANAPARTNEQRELVATDSTAAKADELSRAENAQGFHRSLGTTSTVTSRGHHQHPSRSHDHRSNEAWQNPSSMRDLDIVDASPQGENHDDEAAKRIACTSVPFGSLSEALAYSVFLMLFILATSVVDQDEQGFYLANRLRVALTERSFQVPISSSSPSGPMVRQFAEIQDQQDVWAFLQGPMLDAVFGTSASATATTTASSTAESTSQESSLDSLMLSYNRVLGGIRVRALRVQPDSCPALARMPEYTSLVPYCYGAFTRAIEQTHGYGPVRNHAEITATVAFRAAHTFFTTGSRVTAKTYDDLQTCSTDCARECGEHYGVDRFRYTSECGTQCGLHCKCLYEQPAGFALCPDPNPAGADAALPTANYTYTWREPSPVAGAASWVTGYTSSYPGSGYVVDLPLDAARAADQLHTMEKDRFLDLATRALVVELTSFHAYLQLFTLVRVVIEFPASGGIYASVSDSVLTLFPYSSSSRHQTRIVLELLLVAYMTWTALRLLRRVTSYRYRYRHHHGQQHQGLTLWRTLELLHMAVFFSVVGCRLYLLDLTYGSLTGAVSPVLLAVNGDGASEIPAFQSLVVLVDVTTRLNAANAALAWLRVLQYTQMSQRMALLLRMLRRAAPDLLWFLVYVLIGVAGWAQVGFLLFGLQVAAFRSLPVAWVTLLQAVAGHLPVDELVRAQPALGPAFFIAFYLVLLLILLNVFLAILNDAYVQTLSEQEELDELDQAEAQTQTQAGCGPRERERLRRYPFSRGMRCFLQLLAADCQRAVTEWRAGKRVFKVDPMVSATAAPLVTGDAATASRRLTRQVQLQLETQMRAHVAERDAERAAQEQRTRSEIESQQRELAARLDALVAGNQDKRQRLGDMEATLGAIEKLCQQLVVTALEDTPPAPRKPGLTGGGGGPGVGGGAKAVGGSALAAALQRQKTAGRLATGRPGGGEDIEEIAL